MKIDPSNSLVLYVVVCQNANERLILEESTPDGQLVSVKDFGWNRSPYDMVHAINVLIEPRKSTVINRISKTNWNKRSKLKVK